MHSSADGATASALACAAADVAGALARLPASPIGPVVLIDGRSGSGKSTLAALICAALGGHARIVALDDLYPGWDGLQAGAQAALEQILRPHAAARAAHWRRWDWAAGRYRAADGARADETLIVEGAGALTAQSAALAQVRVWVEAAAGLRKQRALERDGETYRPHWERWAAQEERHLREDDPRSLATLTVAVP